MRTHLLLKSGVLTLISVSLVLSPAFTYGATQSNSSGEQVKKLNTTKIISETNIARKMEGLPKLTKDAKLMRAAKDKAISMAANEYFNHTTPDGKEFTYFINRAGYDYSSIGENIAVYFTSEKGAVASWLASPPHRANIMNRTYKHIGVGLAYGTLNGRSGWFGVQIFGAP